MMFQIRLLVYKRKYVYDDVVISSEHLSKYSKEDCISEQLGPEVINVCTKQTSVLYPINFREKGFNAYVVCLYMDCMNQSSVYRKSAIEVLKDIIKNNVTNLSMMHQTPVILVKLRTPKYYHIDYNWNNKLTQMVIEHSEIEHALSWLSTLGGAFSALGDQFDCCAKVAGKISVKQFKLSMRLGDPQLVARCKLYAALSLLQQGYFKVTKYMVKEIYNIAILSKDVKLQNMCQGIWAKLQYCYYQRKANIKPVQNKNIINQLNLKCL